VQAINYLDERFLDEEDKQMCMTILKSLARGKSVILKRTDDNLNKQNSAA